ncbi:MAG: hypothetical protein ACE5G7_00200 [Candidatus Hydrothermarchaeaceae archaeon]
MREKIGMAMIAIGVLIWPIGLALNLTPVPYILIPHLLFVIPGTYLKGSRVFKRRN